jgi:hypothetical protein
LRNRSDRPSDPGDSPVGDRFADVSIETGQGRSSSSGIGDRLVLGIAVLALLGGVFIIGGKVVGDRLTAAASVSPSAQPSRPAGPTSSDSLPPLVFTLQAGPLPDVPVLPPSFNGWVRALRDVPIYSSPDRASTRVGLLKKGAIAYGTENYGPLLLPPDGTNRWIQLQDNLGSYALVSAGKTRYLELLGSANAGQDGYIQDLIAGADRFAAVGWQPGTGESGSQFMAVSTDAETWETSKIGTLRGVVTSLTYGPAGWVALTQIFNPMTFSTWLWRSDDAISWSLVGEVPDSAGGSLRVRGSPSGYLLLADSGAQSQAPRLLWSQDATRWQEVTPPEWVGTRSTQLIGAPWGFYLQSITFGQATTSSIGASSTDGRTWSMDRTPPTGSFLQVAPTATGLVGVSTSPIGGEPRAWVATLENGAVQWRRDDAGTAALRGAAIPALLSDGQTVLALGITRDTLAPVVYRRTEPDGAWNPEALPPGAFGGQGLYAGAALVTRGGTAFVVLGSRPTLASTNPTLWRRAPDGAWAQTKDQLLSFIPDPPRAACGARPRTALDFALLDPAKGAICFSGEDITFRAWATVCSDCGTADPGFSPAWLADPNLTSALSLSPVMSENTGTPAAVGPKLRLDQRWDHHWVQVTGHFDDPAARTCRFDPGPQYGPGQEGRAFSVIECRKRFVVTRVTLANGP